MVIAWMTRRIFTNPGMLDQERSMTRTTAGPLVDMVPLGLCQSAGTNPPNVWYSWTGQDSRLLHVLLLGVRSLDRAGTCGHSALSFKPVARILWLHRDSSRYLRSRVGHCTIHVINRDEHLPRLERWSR